MKTLETITMEFFETEKLHSKVAEAKKILKKMGFKEFAPKFFSNRVEFWNNNSGLDLIWHLYNSNYCVRFYPVLQRTVCDKTVDREIVYIPHFLKIVQSYLKQFGNVRARYTDDIKEELIELICTIRIPKFEGEWELQLTSALIEAKNDC